MSGDLKIKLRTLFGLAFDIEKDSCRKSGFKPASIDLGIGKELFGDLRLGTGDAHGKSSVYGRRG